MVESTVAALAGRAAGLCAEVRRFCVDPADAIPLGVFQERVLDYFDEREILTRTLDDLYAAEYQLAVLMAEAFLPGGEVDLPEPPD